MWAIPHSSYQSASNDSNLTTHFMWHFYAIRGSSFWPLSRAGNNARHHARFLVDGRRHYLRHLAFFDASNLSLESSLTMLVSTGLQVTYTCWSDRKISGKNRIRLKYCIIYDISNNLNVMIKRECSSLMCIRAFMSAYMCMCMRIYMRLQHVCVHVCVHLSVCKCHIIRATMYKITYRAKSNDLSHKTPTYEINEVGICRCFDCRCSVP